MSNLFTDCECASSMTTDKVHWFLDLFDELGIKVWIDGGWGVDALLGECTRNHQDLDIIISWEDSAILTEALLARGFVDIHTDDHKDRNFVMGHQLYGRIDFHVIELTEGGGAVYGPGEIDWVISESELNAVGAIGGITKCVRTLVTRCKIQTLLTCAHCERSTVLRCSPRRLMLPEKGDNTSNHQSDGPQ